MPVASPIASPGSTQLLLASLAIALVGVGWGVYWIPTRWMQAHGVGPAWMSMITSLVVLAATLPLFLRYPEALRGVTLHGLITGALLAAGFSVYNVSLILTTVVTAVLLFYVSPVWSALLGWLIHGERLSLPRLAALIFGLSGLILTLGFDHGWPIPRQLGDWLALTAGILWALGSVRSYTTTEPGMLNNLLSFNLGGTASSLVCVVVLPAAAGSSVPTLAAWQATLPALIALGLLFVLPSALILVWGTQNLPAPRVGILMMTEVIAGTLTAAALANEPFGPRQMTGCLLIVAAGVLEVLSRVPSRSQPETLTA